MYGKDREHKERQKRYAAGLVRLGGVEFTMLLMLYFSEEAFSCTGIDV